MQSIVHKTPKIGISRLRSKFSVFPFCFSFVNVSLDPISLCKAYCVFYANDNCFSNIDNSVTPRQTVCKIYYTVLMLYQAAYSTQEKFVKTKLLYTRKLEAVQSLIKLPMVTGWSEPSQLPLFEDSFCHAKNR